MSAAEHERALAQVTVERDNYKRDFERVQGKLHAVAAVLDPARLGRDLAEAARALVTEVRRLNNQVVLLESERDNRKLNWSL